MKKSRFLISTLVAAGIMPVQSTQASYQLGFGTAGPDGDDEDAQVRKFAQDHRFILAQHRSHASHASHSSHRSGTSGRSRAPAPAPSPPRPRVTPAPTPEPAPTPPSRNERSNPPSSVLPSSPATAPQSFFATPTGSAVYTPSRSDIIEVVRKVQIGLMAYGYYDGALDGLVGPKTRSALTRFQTDFSFKVTGTITPEVLDALRVVAE
ncbi:hypothetical protein FSZ31_01005 [Sphingorhabdus soli]|uniref:Peptidoglycan binding-like domain-containing protein n=1 Tax=Flavisphingopyxis soli TaxID=2601267 RepID=A0A5C6UMN3_9SPHN|nr:hypothetical protein FSZ31_01005 [Sphingorhabdus soli]